MHQAVRSQLNVALQLDYDLQRQLRNDNMEYLRKIQGKNHALGFSARFALPKSYLLLGWSYVHEGYMDVVRDDWRSFEYFDTVKYQIKRNAFKVGMGNMLMDRKVKIYMENALILGKWGTAYIDAFGPNGKRDKDTLSGSNKIFRTGIGLRSGINVTYPYGRLNFTVGVFSEVLLRSYWKNTTYVDALEPYPRGAYGFNFRIGYNLFRLKL
ncbi:MAG: hypothetical protein JNL57_08350 [Bacteroidetes bacterium]|nr:hypothetical protein [Bacteroidota bacterium]